MAGDCRYAALRLASDAPQRQALTAQPLELPHLLGRASLGTLMRSLTAIEQPTGPLGLEARQLLVGSATAYAHGQNCRANAPPLIEDSGDQ